MQTQKYSQLPETLQEAIQARLEIGDKNMKELFSFISKNPGLSIYAISKKTNWSVGKVSYTINKLKELDVVKEVRQIETNRISLLIYVKKWYDSLPIESLKELKEIIDRDTKK